MMNTASTSNDQNTQKVVAEKPNIEVPRTKAENRNLKIGHIEDNNEDISYFNFPLLWPTVVFTGSSLLFFGLAVTISLRTDYIPSKEQLTRGFIVHYGASKFRCNTSLPFPSDGLPSMLNLFELNVIGNVFFRFCVCIPMVVRIFVSFCLRSILCVEYEDNYSFVYRFCNDLMPIFTGIEVLTMALFSIITVHNDFAEVNRYCKLMFTIITSVNMLITTALTFSFGRNSEEKLDSLSVSIKLVSSIIFCYLSPQYIQQHQTSITFPICHSYLPRMYALMEYCMIGAYATFHLTSLIDIRYVSFMCYPRTCSGECEPLDPRNFKKGAKYEHCRAFEYNQRRIRNL
uniref:Aa_trans domain-containing protein n=1 Tax=Heterorhabditis bacteriophora TaxID=37862 RepID=A0A1I7X781_HETBA